MARPDGWAHLLPVALSTDLVDSPPDTIRRRDDTRRGPFFTLSLRVTAAKRFTLPVLSAYGRPLAVSSKRYKDARERHAKGRGWLHMNRRNSRRK